MTNPIINNPNTATQRAATDAAVAAAATGAATVTAPVTPAAPAAAVLTLALDNGISSTDRLTNDGRVKVSGIADGASWQWSADGGEKWSVASSERSGVVELRGDGAKSLLVKVKDRAGKESISSLDFKLDTVANIVTTTRSGGFDIGKPTLTGSAESGAQVLVKSERSQKLVASLTAAEDGSWTTPVNYLIKLDGLTKTDGSDSKANGTYHMLSAVEAAALANSFSGDFSAQGTSVLDRSHQSFSKTEDGETWYVWANTTGDYIVSRLKDADEWYRAPATGNRGPSDITSGWQALSKQASQLENDLIPKDGSLPRLREIAKVTWSLDDDISYQFVDLTVEQIDKAGNVSAPRGASFHINSTIFTEVDLDASLEGVQDSVSRKVSGTDLIQGVSVAQNVSASLPFDYHRPKHLEIRYYFDYGKPSDDILVLDTEWSVNKDIPLHTDRTIGGIQGINYRYDSGHKLILLSKSASAPTGDRFTGEEIKHVIESLAVKNAEGVIGYRTFRIDLIGGFPAQPSWASLNVQTTPDLAKNSTLPPVTPPLATLPAAKDEVTLELAVDSGFDLRRIL